MCAGPKMVPTLSMSTPTADVARWTPLVRVRGRSMQPALTHGQWLLTRPADGGIDVGDIVVFTVSPGTRYVKRVAAGPGDVVDLEAGRLYVNHRPWDGRARIVGACVATWHVPVGHYFLVGDNLNESEDSRVWSEPFLAASRISGIALRCWPWRQLAHRQGCDSCPQRRALKAPAVLVENGSKPTPRSSPPPDTAGSSTGTCRLD
jgi:signal peptidase I